MAADEPSGSLYIVDAHSVIFQVFHAIAAMSSPAGLPTNALFGFTRDMLFLQQEIRPEYLVCAFDRPEPTFRDAIYPEYKAHRAPMPDDLGSQIPLIYQMLEAMRIPVASYPGYEADDVIATVATAAAQRGLDVLMCSTDRDCRQLTNDRVRLYSLRKRDTLDGEGLMRDWGVRPNQVVDLQALVGDSVDNVPGVPGIGLKTGAKLLQEFDTLDNLLANIDKVAGAKKQENLRAAAAVVQLSRRLVRLATDVPIEMDWESWRLHEPDVPRLLKLFQEWGFHRFADQVRKIKSASVPAPSPINEPAVQGELFPFGANVASPNGDTNLQKDPNWRAKYHLVNAPD